MLKVFADDKLIIYQTITPGKEDFQDIVGKGENAVNSISIDKILDWLKLKAFADDNLNASPKLKFSLGRVENIVGKGENAGYH